MIDLYWRRALLRFSDFAEHSMVMSAVDHRQWTAEEVRALPEVPGKRFECVDGELLVTPGPRYSHQVAVAILIELFRVYCRRHAVGAVLMGPGEFELDAHTLVQPDLFVLPLVKGKSPTSQADTGSPLLFVEVLSPSTARHDRLIKRARYQRQGVEMWIVDLDSRLVERWSADNARPEILTNTLEWQPANAPEPLVINLPELFAESLGER